MLRQITVFSGETAETARASGLLNSSADPKPSEFKKEGFLVQPLIQNIFQTNLERVRFTKATGANYKMGDNYKPSRASRLSKHPSFKLRIAKSLRRQIFKRFSF